jgi:hypothetical protein
MIIEEKCLIDSCAFVLLTCKRPMLLQERFVSCYESTFSCSLPLNSHMTWYRMRWGSLKNCCMKHGCIGILHMNASAIDIDLTKGSKELMKNCD